MGYEIVKPVEVEGIEFYCSSDGKQTGVSQVGVSRLAGLSEINTRRLLTEIERLSDRQKNEHVDEESTASAPIQAAALAICNGFVDRHYLELTSANQAKVVNSKLVSRIVRYYAYHAPKKSEVAVFSYDKFADIGMDSWVKTVTKFEEAGDMFILMSSMNNTLLLLGTKVEEMSIQLKQTENYRSASIQLVGLKQWMDSIDKEEFNQIQLPSADEEELFTLTEWAAITHDGLILPRSTKHSLANTISRVYTMMELSAPTKVSRFNEKGYKLQPVQAYPRRHFVLINMCYTKLVSGA